MMVAFYKHSIIDWRNGTAQLSDRAYRVYHVVIEQIYLNEGPIRLHERTLAGLSNRSVRDLQRALEELYEVGKLSLVDGRLHNRRASFELEGVEANRENAGKGGRTPRGNPARSPREVGEIAPTTERALRDTQEILSEINGRNEAPLHSDGSLKDKTRLEKTVEVVAVERAHESAREGPPTLADADRLAAAVMQHIPEGHALRADPLDAAACLGWLRSGFDPERDILPGVQRAMAGEYRFKRWAKFTGWIERVHADRIAAETARSPPEPTPFNHSTSTKPRTGYDQPTSKIAIGAWVRDNPPPGYS